MIASVSRGTWDSALPTQWSIELRFRRLLSAAPRVHTPISRSAIPTLFARHGTRQPFRDVITDVENALDLQQHKPGTLPAHAPYLHQHAAGRIGSLTRLIRQAAITERITKTALDAVQLDYLAEQHRRPTRNR